MTAPMNTNFLYRHAACAAVLLSEAGAALSAPAAPFKPVLSLAKKEKAPLLELTPANAALAKHAQTIYAEIGKELVIGDVAEGGGTDAAFAALKTKAPVIERFGLQGFGAHSNDTEYVYIDFIEPRLYLLSRMLMDVSQSKNR